MVIVKSAYNQEPRSERRVKPDLLIRLIQGITIVGLLMMLPILIFIERARPEMESLFDRWFRTSVQDGWITEFLVYALVLTAANLAITSVGVVLHFKRNKRREDRYRFSLMLPFVFSIFAAFYLAVTLVAVG